MSLNFKKFIRGHQIAGATKHNKEVKKRQYKQCSTKYKPGPLRDSCQQKYRANNNPSTRGKQMKTHK